jgi:hypothetical protein
VWRAPSAEPCRLAEAEALVERFGLGLISQRVAIARAELEGCAPSRVALRAITARTGRRQRALLRAQARAFQPSAAGRLCAVVAFELARLESMFGAR